jgi:hemin uptake protein HemP
MNLQPDMRADLYAQSDDCSLPAANEPKRLTSESLIGPAREILIRHAGFDYRLRITRQGKLILTK